MGQTIYEILVYSCVGIVSMLLGYIIIDWVIPCDFSKEIKAGNKSIGWVSAGIYIGLGIIVSAAVESITVGVKYIEIMYGIIDTVFYSAVGIAFFIIGYFVVDIVNKKFNFNEELKNGNEAAGIMIFGIFVGIAFIISGVIR